jgi:ferredoxin-nitrite reductase
MHEIEVKMRPGANPIEEYKQTKGGDPLRIREDLPRLTTQGWEALSAPDKELLKWVGVFFRKPTPGKFMMRIRMPNGFATSRQLATISDLSARLGNGSVDITTRQQIELRGYGIESIPEIFERLRGVDLSTLQTGQDNVRNINGCPLAGVNPNELLDASPILFDLDRTFVGDQGNAEFANLPRKMNVVVTGCVENCTHSESQDIALVPATKFIHGTLYSGFHVLVGGKMGSGGFTIASNLGWFIEPDQARDVVVQIVKLFRDEGERGPRTKCRLAFLLEAWGLDRFREELVKRLGWEPLPEGKDARSEGHNDHFGVHQQKQPGLYSVGLRVNVGRIRHESLRELGRLADVYGNGAVRLTTGQDAILINIAEHQLDALLDEPLLRELPPEPSRFFRGMVACTGTDFCNIAQIDTKGWAMQISTALEKQLGPDGKPLTIHWSGCPAGCGNHLAADIGLRGMKVNVEGKSIEAVAVYVGGKTGPQARAGTQIMDLVPCDEALPDVLANVVKHLPLFKRVQAQPTVRDRILMVPADMQEEDLETEEIERPAAVSLSELKENAPVPKLTVANVPSKKALQVKVCTVNDLKAGAAYPTAVQGKSLALFLHGDGRIFAIDAVCPHAAGPLEEGKMDNCEVICPLHDYRFDLATGRCSTDPEFAVKTYPVVVEENQVWVEIHA